MSQRQPRRPPQGGCPEEAQAQDRPIKYGDVFDVSGELAGQAVAPRDAALMQSAESVVLGKAQKGGPAAVMQSAATLNERAGLVGHGQLSGPAADRGVAVAQTDIPGRRARVITEAVAGQVVGRYETPAPVEANAPSGALEEGAMTIGQALEAAAVTAGEKPVEQSDAAAIQAAEMLATGGNITVPGGVAAAAQSAADVNARAAREDDKTRLRDVISDASEKLPADKGATREDAERVVSAETRNKLDMATTPGGVAAAVTAAARLNQERP